MRSDDPSPGDDPNPSSEKTLWRNQIDEYQKRREMPSNALAGKISAYEGKPAIYFEKTDIVPKAEKFKFCLIGKFPRSWPSLAETREWMSREWKLKGEWSVTLLDTRHFFFRLDNESDMLRIWMRRRWFVLGHLMRVFKWTPDFRQAEGEPCSAPIWIGLPFLPVVFFQEDLLIPIASLVGSVLATDSSTKTLSRTHVARICVEVDLSRELPRKIWIGIGEGVGFWQDICYEKLPSYCLNCRRQGHSTKICWFNTINEVKEDFLDTENNSDLQSQVTKIPQTVTEGNKKMIKANKRDDVSIKNLMKEVGIQHANCEKLPSYCLNCRRQGHSTKICWFNTRNAVKGDSLDQENNSSLQSQVTEIGLTVNEGNKKMLKANKRDDVFIKNPTKEVEIQDANCEKLQETHQGILNCMECLTEEGLPVTIQSSSVYKLTKSSSHWKMDRGFSKDCRTSDAFDQNSDRKRSQAKLSQIVINPSIQDERGKNHPSLRSGTRAKSTTTDRSLGNSKKIESKKKNKGTESSKGGPSLPTDELIQSVSHSCHGEEKNSHTSINPSFEEWNMMGPMGSSKTPRKHTVNEGNRTGFVNNEIQHVVENGTEKEIPLAHKSISKPGDSKFGSFHPMLKKKDQQFSQAMNKQPMKHQGSKSPIRRKYSPEKQIFFWKKKTKSMKNLEVFLKNHGDLSPKRYKYTDVKSMTDSFRHKLGQGGFGNVFKGMLPDGRLVAVKVLNESKGKVQHFINEVACIGTTHHVNIVNLLGFCAEGSKRALIYEFMPSGSLDQFIYKKRLISTHPLGWEKLCQIAVGIARGLDYLHCWCNTRILHFDIKPHNILLDENLCPKISDFGLAKLCPMREGIVSLTGARGTIGYIAPELLYENFRQVSYKSDVYSYGMMILEMVGGRKNIDAGVENCSEVYYPCWIYKHLNQQEDTGVGRFSGTVEEETARKMILVGLWCIQNDPEKRPSMSRVVQMLEGSIECLQIPPDPFAVTLFL